ncbi:MAG TPA: hypothetical protein VGC14_24060 [Rhizobium sp.]
MRRHGNIEATTATVRTDLDILGTSDGMPELPVFPVNLHLPKGEATLPATEPPYPRGLMRP